MDGGKSYHLRSRDQRGNQDGTSAKSIYLPRRGSRNGGQVSPQIPPQQETTRRRRRVAFADSENVDHEATTQRRRERSVTPYAREVSTPETPKSTSIVTRKRRNAELDKDSLSAVGRTDSSENRKKRGNNHSTSTPTPVRTLAKKRRKVQSTSDTEGPLLPPTPLPDGHTYRRSTRIRERSIGPSTPLLPTTPVLAPVIPTPAKPSVRVINPTSPPLTWSRYESTPELPIDDAPTHPISPESPSAAPSTPSRINISELDVPSSDTGDTTSSRNDFPSVPKRADSPLIYQPVDLVPLSRTPHVGSDGRETNSELPSKVADEEHVAKLSYLASPVLFDMHPHVSSLRNLQNQELPPYARLLDYSRDGEKPGAQYQGLSLLASTAISPPIPAVPSQHTKGAIESRPALTEVAPRVLHPESAIREERPDFYPTQPMDALIAPHTASSTAAKRRREMAAPEELDMHKIAENVYMGSSNIARFLGLGIRRIYTIRMRDEVTMEWDKTGNDSIDSDENLHRTWIEVKDDAFANILPVLCTEIPEIKLESQNSPVYIHCHAGRSRSAAFVVALLMTSIPSEHDNSLIACLRRVKQKRPKVSINPGFIHQLRIWEAYLNRPDDLLIRQTPEYQHWKKARESGVVAVTGMPEDRIKASVHLRHAIPRKPTFAAPGSLHNFPTTISVDSNVHCALPWSQFYVPKEYYRCTECFFPLAPKVCTFHLFNYSDTGNGESCTHAFLCKAMLWMDGQIDHCSPGGKLFCNHCYEQVGEYCWMGVRCACGELSAPGVALTRTRGIDGEWCGWELHTVEEEENSSNQRPSPRGENNESAETMGTEEGQDSRHGFFDGDPTSGHNVNSDPNIKQWVDMDVSPSQLDSGVAISRPSQKKVSSPGNQSLPQSAHSENPGERRYSTAAQVLMAGPKIKKSKHLKLPRSIEISRAPRPPYHKPTCPSPLRNTWRPHSRSSSRSSTKFSPSSYSDNEIRGAEYDAVRLPTHFSESDSGLESQLSGSFSTNWLSPPPEILPEVGDDSERMSIGGVPWPPRVYSFEEDSQGMSIDGGLSFVGQEDGQQMSLSSESQSMSIDWHQASQAMSIVDEPWQAEEMTDEDAPFEIILGSGGTIVSDVERQRLLQSSILLDEINVFEEDMFRE